MHLHYLRHPFRPPTDPQLLCLSNTNICVQTSFLQAGPETFCVAQFGVISRSLPPYFPLLKTTRDALAQLGGKQTRKKMPVKPEAQKKIEKKKGPSDWAIAARLLRHSFRSESSTANGKRATSLSDEYFPGAISGTLCRELATDVENKIL